MIKTKRAYDSYDQRDGRRVLVDRLWPRGLTKEKVRLDTWMKEIAPSDGLRKWFQHDPNKWEEFKQRYRQELETKKQMIDLLLEWASKGELTLLYSSKEETHNNAIALKEFLDELIKTSGGRGRITSAEARSAHRRT